MDLNTCESFGVSSYVSAPTSPGGASLSSTGVYFYSVPTSPTSGQKDVPFDLESEISSSDSNGFEFRTSQQFEKKRKKKKKEESCGGDEDSSAMMAFADELFSNGQVLPLKYPPHPEEDQFFHNSKVPPLKLPPRLQQVEKGKCGNRSSSGSSPRSSPSSLLRWPILCCNLRNQEFDPFIAALEHVMKESPKRFSHGSIPGEPTEIAGLVSASLVGYSQSRSDHGGCINPNFTKFSGSEENTCESLGRYTTVNGESYRKGSEKHSIKNFIFRDSFKGWVSKKEKLRDQTRVLRKSHYFRRFNFKSFYANLQCKERRI
ncbi:hypothetical protein NE237_003935 [Protea cynaroides]|uniref:Uncharacterized protein n=1 Tax=Protea cynaroides TaxID=273540 RepID=A0A9Q0KIF4_9MAGN|nr:hypothetical protein NE237_003935 [Protea cynaroides]